MLKSKIKNLILNKYAIALMMGLFWLPILVFGVLNLKLVNSIIANENTENLKRASEIQAEAIDKFVRSNYEQVTALANTPRVTAIINDKRHRELDKNNFNFMGSLFLIEVFTLDTQGVITNSSVKNNIGKSEAHREYFRYVMIDKRSQMVVNSEDKISPELMFAAPVLNLSNDVIGVFAIKYSLSILQEIVAPHYQLAGEMSYGVIINDRQDVIASTVDFDLDFAPFSAYLPDIHRHYEQLLSRKQRSYFDSEHNIGVSYTVVGQSGWVSVYVRPSGNLLSGFTDTMNNVLMILALVFVLAAITNYFIYSLIQKIRRREQELKRINDEIMKDLDLGVKVQKALQYVPRLPENLDFATFQKAAKFVSGDLCFTYFNSALQVFTFMIIDVNGKGVQAALKAAAFSSIAKSVWTSRESYEGGKDRFDIFVNTATRFIKTTNFASDFLAVVGCEFNLHDNSLNLYRLNYTAPFKINMKNARNKVTMSRLNVPNGKTVKTSLASGEALMLLGDAFLESSRAEKRIVSEITRQFSGQSESPRADNIAEAIRNTDLGMVKEDDQTILILNKAA